MFHFLGSHGKQNSTVYTGDESVQGEKYNSVKPRNINGTSSSSQVPCDKDKLLPQNDVSRDILLHDNKQIESASIENKEKISDEKTKFWNSGRSASDENWDDKIAEARSSELQNTEFALQTNKATSYQTVDETARRSKEEKETPRETDCHTTKRLPVMNLEKETVHINIFSNVREFFQEIFEKARKQVAHQSRLKCLRSKEKTINWKPAKEIVNTDVFVARKDDSVTPNIMEKREVNSQKNVRKETRVLNNAEEQVSMERKSGRDTKDQHPSESKKKSKRVKKVALKYHRSKKMKLNKTKKRGAKTDKENDEVTEKKNNPEDIESGLRKKKTDKRIKDDPDLKSAGKVKQQNAEDDQILKKGKRRESSEGLTTLAENQTSKENNPNKNYKEGNIDVTGTSPYTSCHTLRIKNAKNKKSKCTDTRRASRQRLSADDLRNTPEERRGSPTYERRIITIGPKINKQKSEKVKASTDTTAKKRKRKTIKEVCHKASNIRKTISKKKCKEDQEVTTKEGKTDLISNPDSSDALQENPGQKVKKARDDVCHISCTTTEHTDSQQPTTDSPEVKKTNKGTRESNKSCSEEKKCRDVPSRTKSKIGNRDNEKGNGTSADYYQDEDKEQAEVEIRGKKKKGKTIVQKKRKLGNTQAEVEIRGKNKKGKTIVQKKKKRKLGNDAEREPQLFTGEDVKQAEGVGRPVEVTTTSNTQCETEHMDMLSMKESKRIGSKKEKKAREARKKKKRLKMTCEIEEKSEGKTPNPFGEVEKGSKSLHIKEDCSSESRTTTNKTVAVKLKTLEQLDQDSCHLVGDVQKEKETQRETNKKSTVEENDFDSKEIKQESTEFVNLVGNVTKVARTSNFYSRSATTPEDHVSHHRTFERFSGCQQTGVNRRFSTCLGTPNSAKKARFSPYKSPAESSFNRRLSWQPYISRCAICKTTDHTINDPDCPAYDPHPAKRICFKGPLCCMSNMYPCKLIYQGITFKSTEQAYQWQRALDIGRVDVALKMIKSVDGFEAKRLSNELEKARVAEWKEKNCIRVMTELIEAKFEQVEDFRQACIESTDAYLMETTFDTFWGVGLLEEAAKSCKLDYLPGKNILGWIIMQVRNKHVRLNNHLQDIYQDRGTGRKEMPTFFQGIGHLFGKPFGRDLSVQKNLDRSSNNSPYQSSPSWKRPRPEQSPKTKFTSTLLQSFSGQDLWRNYPIPCSFGPKNFIAKSAFVRNVMDARGHSDGDTGVTLQQHSLGINTIHPSLGTALADATNFYPLAPSSELMSPRRNDVITPSIDQAATFSGEDRKEDEIKQSDSISIKTGTGVDNGFELIVYREGQMNVTPFVKSWCVKDGDITKKEKKEPTEHVLRLVEYDTDSSDQDNDCCEKLKYLQGSDVEVVNGNKSQKVESPRQKHAANGESRRIHMSSDVSVGLVKKTKIHRNTGLKTPSQYMDPQF